MMIGENLEEDKEPGKLLNKILSAMGLTRKEAFIFSEITKSKELISNQDIDLLINKASPKIVICFGSVATDLVLDIKGKIRDVRNKFYEKDGVKVISTYHPAALIHDPSNKKFVWDDMKLVMEEIKKIEK
jgi:DNA polymerase